MIRSFRRTRFGALLSAATLVCVATLSIASFFHSDTDDTLCNGVVVLHDHAAHRLIADDGSSRAPEHCFICHWTSLRTVQTAIAFDAPAIESRGLACVDRTAFAAQVLASQPARAPPLA